MRCLTEIEIQAVADGEADHTAAGHARACAACAARVRQRADTMAGLAAELGGTDTVPPGASLRLSEAAAAGAPVRGATVLRGGAARWRAARVVPALAAAAALILLLGNVLPRLGAPATLSAAEVLGRSLQTLSGATGVERLEYELSLAGLSETRHRLEHLLDHDTPARYRLVRYGPDGLAELAVAQDPATGRRTQMVRLDGRNYVISVPIGPPLPSLPHMAQAQLEAVIAMMQANADGTLTVMDDGGATRYVIQVPPIVPRREAAVLDLHEARAVVDGRDYRIREFDARGTLLKQPFAVWFRQIRHERVDLATLSPDAFTIVPEPGDVTLEGAASDDPLGDALLAALREIGRLTAR